MRIFNSDRLFYLLNSYEFHLIFYFVFINVIFIEQSCLIFFGLNMFLIPQVSAKFGISPSSKLLTNLVLHLSKCMNLVLLTKFC